MATNDLENDDIDVNNDDSSENLNRTYKKSVENRELTEEELKKLENDVVKMPQFKKEKIEKELKKSWDLFYKRNKTNFFKDRYWIFREFEELNDENLSKEANKTLLEIGCGVGNFFFPLLKANKTLQVCACDFSDKAIELVKSNESYNEYGDRLKAFVCDITKDDLEKNLADKQVDIVTLIFVLSALKPDKMCAAIRNVYKVVKPGGIVLVRDYGLYDHAMMRFDNGQKIYDKCYVRCDNTLSYFFDLNELNNLFTQNGFNIKTSEYVFTETVNVKENIRVPRVFVQSKFIKSDTI